MKDTGFDLLARQAVDAVAEHASFITSSWALSPRAGDTPIERLFYCSLYLHTAYADMSLPWTISTHPYEQSEPQHETLFLARQATLDGIGRVDFLLTVFSLVEPRRWHHLIVECDGHDFHERTKEQAANDRSRDRAATLAGYTVMRFTGSELWRDPWGCAAQAIRWADQTQWGAR